MKLKLRLLLFLLVFSFCNSFCQISEEQEEEYTFLVTSAKDMLTSTNYDSCMIYFHEAFKIKQTSYLSTLRYAACAYSNGNSDLYTQQMSKAIALSWDGTKTIFDNYEEFVYLKGTDFETDLSSKYMATATAEGINLELMEEFQMMRVEDQKYRSEMRGVSEKYGWDSPQMDSLWKLQGPIDDKNTKRICELMDEIGYPGKSVVGSGEASTAFLIIQHSNLETQEKYLHLITEAADNDEVRWSSLALLVDRVNMGQGKPQIYGSQIKTDKSTGEYYFAEIADPFKVDSLRANVGLGPLQAYADHWDFEWNPEKHMQKIKAIKAAATK